MSKQLRPEFIALLRKPDVRHLSHGLEVVEALAGFGEVRAREGSRQNSEVFLPQVDGILKVEGLAAVGNLVLVLLLQRESRVETLNLIPQHILVLLRVGICLLVQHDVDLRLLLFWKLQLFERPATDTE